MNNVERLAATMKEAGAKARPGVSAPNAIATIQKRKQYQTYAEDAQTAGEAPIPFEQWVAKK